MRLLLAVLVMILTIVFLGFLATNLHTTVPVTVFQTEYPDVHLAVVVLGAFLFMAVLVGILAVAEGAGIRLENRRLKRELHKLETEINYLRTQPPSLRSEPDELVTAGSRPEVPPSRPEEGTDEGHRPSAPVYGNDGDDWDPDSDDDVYTGGRAV